MDAAFATALRVVGYDFLLGGEAFEKDPIRGAECIQVAAASLGDPGSQVMLSGMYWGGIGVLQDWILAHMWMSLAALQGAEGARRSRDIAWRES